VYRGDRSAVIRAKENALAKKTTHSRKAHVKAHVRPIKVPEIPQPGMVLLSKFNRKELDEFKKVIMSRRNDILDNLNGRDDTLKQTQKEASGDISGYTYHMADVATDNYDREFSLGIASNERQLLYEFDDALKKIEEKTYGRCEDCKSMITKTRLKAVPYTRHCLACQEKREKK
jgi:DnaK suppressor protein